MNKKAFQSKTNWPLADRCLGYIVNKFEHVRGGAKKSHVNKFEHFWRPGGPHWVGQLGQGGDPYVGGWGQGISKWMG